MKSTENDSMRKEVILKNFDWIKADECYYKLCGLNSKPAVITIKKVNELTEKKLKDELERLEGDAREFKNLSYSDFEELDLYLKQMKENKKDT